jgi:hypothetical protein
VRFQVLTVVSTKFRVFWDVGPCSHVEVEQSFIALMMEAVCTSETSFNFNITTQCYIPEDSKLQTKNVFHIAADFPNDFHVRQQ